MNEHNTKKFHEDSTYHKYKSQQNEYDYTVLPYKMYRGGLTHTYFKGYSNKPQ